MVLNRILNKVFMEPQINFNDSKCLRINFTDSACDKCSKYCYAEAITADDGIKVSLDKCDGCGLCVGVCPSGAFNLDKPTYEQLIQEVQQKKTINLTCQRLEAIGTCSVPCLGYLTESLLVTLVIVSNKYQIIYNPEECAKCHLHAGLLVKERLNRVKKLVNTFGKDNSLYITASHCAEELSRSEFFSFLKSQTKSLLSPLLINGESRADEEKYSKYFPLDRQLLAEKIDEALLTKEKVLSDEDSWPFTQLEVRDKCIGCGDCSNLCPTKALRVKQQENIQELIHFPILCINCGICIDKCPRKALLKKPLLDLNLILSGISNLIKKISANSCSRCGRPITLTDQYEESEFCNICQEEAKQRLNSKKRFLSF